MKKSEECRDLVLDLYNKGMSITKISKTVGISQPTISKILKTAGVSIRRENYQKLSIDPAIINKLYNEGSSTYELAKLYNCSDETIRKMIHTIRDIKERNHLSEESILKIKAASIRNWSDDEYRAKVKSKTDTIEYRQKLSNSAKANYADSLGRWITSMEAKTIISSQAKKLWQDPKYREEQLARLSLQIPQLIQASKAALQDPVKRAQWINKIRINNAEKLTGQGWISSSQKQLYYILSSSAINYYEEGQDTRVGPFYVVDCVIPVQQKMIKPLIIEVQGEYWHSLPHVVTKDRQKETYIRKHTNYDLLKLEELHMSSFDEVSNKLSSFGLDIAKIECKPKDLTIDKITEADAALFYSIFHYTGTIRKGAIVYGAFYNDELLAAISYCHPVRIEASSKQGFAHREVLEISRLARKTNFICKNLMSYFISKTLKLLPSHIKCIISYSDATYNHTGSVYKASGFKYDGAVAPDYYYISINGKYHKKTIWDRSKRMKMSEQEYANKHNLLKIYGKEKARWVYVV